MIPPPPNHLLHRDVVPASNTAIRSWYQEHQEEEEGEVPLAIQFLDEQDGGSVKPLLPWNREKLVGETRPWRQEAVLVESNGGPSPWKNREEELAILPWGHQEEGLVSGTILPWGHQKEGLVSGTILPWGNKEEGLVTRKILPWRHQEGAHGSKTLLPWGSPEEGLVPRTIMPGSPEGILSRVVE